MNSGYGHGRDGLERVVVSPGELSTGFFLMGWESGGRRSFSVIFRSLPPSLGSFFSCGFLVYSGKLFQFMHEFRRIFVLHAPGGQCFFIFYTIVFLKVTQPFWIGTAYG